MKDSRWRYRLALGLLPIQLLLAAALAASGYVDLASALFVALPLSVGVSAGLISSWRQMWKLTGVLLVLPCVLLAFTGIEGLLCVALAAPLLAGMLALGHGLGAWLRRYRHRDDRQDPLRKASLLLPSSVFLVVAVSEQFVGVDYAANHTETSIELPYPAETVFAALVHVDSVRAEPGLLHLLGLPLPLSSRVDTLAVGGRRSCRLSEGVITERIVSLTVPKAFSMDMGGANMGRPWLRLERDSYRLQSDGPRRTRVTHSTSFSSTLRPRLYWSAVERVTVGAQHDIVFRNLLLDLVAERSSAIGEAALATTRLKDCE